MMVTCDVILVYIFNPFKISTLIRPLYTLYNIIMFIIGSAYIYETNEICEY